MVRCAPAGATITPSRFFGCCAPAFGIYWSALRQMASLKIWPNLSQSSRPIREADYRQKSCGSGGSGVFTNKSANG